MLYVAFARFHGEAVTGLRTLGLFNEKLCIKDGSIEEIVVTLVEDYLADIVTIMIIMIGIAHYSYRAVGA
jgi:hypothetical protein